MFLSKNSKSPYYQVIYFVNGKRTKKSTKTTNKKEAENFLIKFKLQFNPDAQPQKLTPITLSKFEKEYIAYTEQNKTKSYIKSVKLSFSQFTSKAGDISLTHISLRLIDQFVSEVHSKSPYAAKMYYATLKAAFSKAVHWNYLNNNPFKKIKAPKVPKSFPVFISENELLLILSKIKSQMMKNIFTTAFYTGMRLGELLNMKWNWIDFSRNIIIVKNSEDFKSKSKRERIIPIHPKVLIIFQYLFPIGKSLEDNPVFNKLKGVKLNEDFVSKQFKKAVRAVELNDAIHFHSLRHSFASGLVQRGASIYAVKELLGHEDIKTTQIYSHLQKENLSQAVNLL